MNLEEQKTELLDKFFKFLSEKWNKYWYFNIKPIRTAIWELYKLDPNLFTEKEKHYLREGSKVIDKLEDMQKITKNFLEQEKSFELIINSVHHLFKGNNSDKEENSNNFKDNLKVSDENDLNQMLAVCVVCNKHFDNKRKALGYDTCLECGDIEAKSNAPKVDEGLPGSRQDHKRMRGQIFSDLKKRSRGNE